jgi:hypothetical protein
MNRNGIVSALIVVTVGCRVVSAQDERSIAAARAMFDKYVALERAFDPAMAGLYASDAVIRNKRTYPTGQVREITLPATQYKQLIRQAMPLAKQRGDTNRYSECEYSPEGERVRIKCTRYSELKKYSSPMSLLVGPGPKGDWLVFEEISESQP